MVHGMMMSVADVTTLRHTIHRRRSPASGAVPVSKAGWGLGRAAVVVGADGGRYTAAWYVSFTTHTPTAIMNSAGQRPTQLTPPGGALRTHTPSGCEVRERRPQRCVVIRLCVLR